MNTSQVLPVCGAVHLVVGSGAMSMFIPGEPTRVFELDMEIGKEGIGFDPTHGIEVYWLNKVELLYHLPDSAEAAMMTPSAMKVMRVSGLVILSISACGNPSSSA